MSDLTPPQLPPLPTPNFVAPALHQPSPEARQASILLFVLGGLALFWSMLAFLCLLVPQTSFSAEQFKDLQDSADLMGLSVEDLFLAMGIAMLMPGVVLTLLGLLVRTGRRWAILAAIAADGVLLLIFGGAIVVSAVTHQGNDPGDFVIRLFAAGLCAWLMTRLTAARRAAKLARLGADQLQARFWFGSDSGY